MKLQDFLSTLGLSDKEIDIYLATVGVGKVSASLIAEQLGRERTSTYKMMNNMVSSGRLSNTHERGTTFFMPVSLGVLRQRFDTHHQKVSSIVSNYEQIDQEYHSLLSAHKFPSKVKLLSGLSSINYAYQEILNIIKSQNISYIYCVANNTLANFGKKEKANLLSYENFLQKIQQLKITVANYLGTGIEIMEKLSHSLNSEDIQDLPQSNGATQLWIIGHDVFFLLFGSEFQSIHIHTPQMAELLTFLIEQTTKPAE